MQFDFDTPVPLANTHSQKWDGAAGYSGSDHPDLIAMWVADMDFRAPQPVLDALQAEIDRGVMGYYGLAGSATEAISAWMRDQHGWPVDPSWVTFTNGVIHGLSIIIEAFSDPGDAAIVFSPVYHAFARKLRQKNREIHEAPLIIENGQFQMDLEALASSLTGREKILILCSPHNPGGRLWTKEEIKSVAAFCETHDLILVSDEIHMDLTFPGIPHLPTATVAPESLPRLIVLTAASKGFNLAGGETGIIITPDRALQKRLQPAIASHGGSPNRFGMIMLEAAFRHGRPWSEAVRAYIAENFSTFKTAIDALPGVSVMDMQATYLTWVDFSGTGMSMAELNERITKDAGIATNPGPTFGTGGDLCQRFNIATPRATLQKACERLAKSFGDLQ